MSSTKLSLISALALTLQACSQLECGPGTHEDEGQCVCDPENDTDTDADADTDTDTYTDTDTDTDSDADSDIELWQPAPETSWQWQLQGEIDTSLEVAMYDVDLYEPPDTTIAALHADGRVVICYFSAGSREEWRDDAGEFPDDAIGSEVEGWPGEHWVDINDPTVRAIMQARMDYAVERGCDGVEPDLVDGWSNDNGLGLTAPDQLDYNRFLADEAHARGLSVGLKNDVDQAAELEPWFDWALNEECMAWSECGDLSPFLEADKAVFHVEYVDEESEGEARAAEVCGDPSIAGFSTLIKQWDLLAWGISCL